MMRGLLFLFLVYCSEANAQTSKYPLIDTSTAIVTTVEARQVIDCGIRDAAWGNGVFAEMMILQAAALAKLEDSDFTENDALGQWRQMAHAMSSNSEPIPSVCSNYTNDSMFLSKLDKLSSEGNASD